MSLLEALILGAVQGITEFFPVSSSGHLVIAQSFIPGFEQPGILFDVILHAGTLLAVCVYFFSDIRAMLQGFLFGGREEKKMMMLVIVGSIPTAIIGLSCKDLFESLFSSVFTVGCMLIVTGSFLFLIRFVKRNEKKEITYIDAILIGIMQGIAIVPGLSRSGLTICTGITRKIDSETAGRFSFLLSLPAICGALLLEGRHVESLSGETIAIYMAGAVSAMVVGLLAIRFLMAMLQAQRFSLFSYYCWTAGIVAVVFYY